MFDTARKWAYPQWWQHRTGTGHDWDQLVLQRCHAVNTDFNEPLPFTEVQATAQSISRWIWRNFTEEQYRARKSAIGSRGGAISGKIMTPAKREANRLRATKFNLTQALEIAL